MESVLWGVKVGAPDWDEQVITTAKDDPAKLAKAREWAAANGFDRLRVAVMDDAPPDFVGTIR